MARRRRAAKNRTYMLIAAGLAISMAVTLIAVTFLSVPHPWFYADRRQGVGEDGFSWDMGCYIQVLDSEGEPILVRLVAGALYVWDEQTGQEVEVGSFYVRLTFHLDGPEATLDWNTVTFQATFRAQMVSEGQEGPVVELDTQTVTGVKDGQVEATITVVFMEEQGLFEGLGSYDYILYFFFSYHASVDKLAGGTVQSPSYTKTVSLQVAYVQDAIYASGTPGVTANP